MVRLPKSIIKKYGITKRAWQVFRASKKPKTMGAKMKRKRGAAKRRSVVQSVRLGAVPAIRPRRRRAVSLLSGSTMKTIIDGGIIGGSALGTTFAMQKLPWIGTRPAWQKAITLAALGLLGVTFVRSPLVKKISSGAIVGGVICGFMPLMPEGFKFSGRELSPDEMEELATMGGLMEIPALGRPFTPPGATMGAPIPIAQMGRSGRNYTAAY